MILRSLELKHFGKFGERSFEFRRGMNLVSGPNEAGKSTLMEAIPAVLFGVRNKERFRPWGRQGSSEAALVVECGNRTVRIERDILGDQVQLTERDDLYETLYSFEGKASPQGRSSERAEYLDRVARLFGLAEEELFRASLHFGQGSLEIKGQGGLAGRIKTLLSGFVEVDYDQVLNSLVEDHFAITRSNPWGKDKSKDRELDEIRNRIGELEKEWFAAQESVKALGKLREEIGELSASIDRDREEYDKGVRYLAWVRKQWQLEEKEVTLKKDFDRVNRQAGKVSELEEERRDLEKELAKTGLPREIPDDLPVLLAEAEEGRRELVGLQGESSALREQLLAHASPPWKLSALLSLLLPAAAGSLFWLRPEWLTQGLMGAGLASALVWIVYLVRAGRERSERSRIKGQAQVLERKREEAQAKLAGLDERFERIGMSPSAVEIVKMQKNLERSRQISRKLAEVESALKVLEKNEELTRDKEDLTRELAVLDERMERERPLRSEGLLTLEELPEAEEKLGKLGESLKEAEKELLELTRREAALQGELHDLQRIEEEGERLKERETELARRREALVVGHDLLAGAVEEFRRTYLQRFAGQIGHYLGVATRGRYAEVRLDEDFSLFLKARGGGWQPVEHFSRGTVDAVYFSVRLALTRHLSSGRRLPLFLDDPLVNFDSPRLQETLGGLEEFSGEHQVVLFTHDERLLKRAAKRRWNVISLEEPKAASNEAEEERSDDVGQLYLL